MRSVLARYAWIPLLVLVAVTLAVWQVGGGTSDALWNVCRFSAILLLVSLAYRQFHFRHGSGAKDAVLARGAFVSDVASQAHDLGLEPADLGEIAARWGFPPFAVVRTVSVLGCWAGERGGRRVVVTVVHDADAFVVAAAARVNEPAETMAWVSAAPAARPFDPPVTWHEVPAPEGWSVRAGNPRYASMLMAEAPSVMAGTPRVWRIDFLDAVRVETFPLDGAAPAVPALLEEAVAVAEAAERVIRAGYGDRPYTPSWPEGSQVRERFPADVVAALTEAGWSEGRSVEVEASFPAGEAALREFGGLTLGFAAPSARHEGGTFTLDPAPVADVVRALSPWNGRRLCPLGRSDGPVLGSPVVLAVAENGLVLALRDDDDLLLGHSMDEAVIKLVRGLFAPTVGNHGSLRRP